MAITRSTTKRHVIETIRVHNMGWPEYIFYKLDPILGALALKIYNNLFLFYCILLCSLVAAYIEASSDTFELIVARIQQREPVLSEPPKSVTIYQFLGLDEVKVLVEEHTLAACLFGPVFAVACYHLVTVSTKTAKRRKTLRMKQHKVVTEIVDELFAVKEQEQ